MPNGLSILSLAVCAALVGSPAFAQGADGEDETEEEAEKKSPIEQATELVNAVAAMADDKNVQVTADAEKTGQFEIDLLGLGATAEMARQISETLCGKAGKEEERCKPGESKRTILVLADGESYVFGLPAVIGREMDALLTEAIDILSQEAGLVDPFVARANEFIGAAEALAGLLRNERTLKEFTIASVSDRLLADAVAVQLASHGVESRTLLGSPGTRIGLELPPIDELAGDHSLAEKYAGLLVLRGRFASAPDGPKAKWVEKFDAFDKTSRTKPKDGEAPLVVALNADGIERDLDGILLVDLSVSGGTRTTSKNFGTTVLGLDPFRVTGGLGATYLYYPATANQRSSPAAWGAVSCATDELRLDEVRKVDFAGGKDAVCRVIGALP
ncbi:MAG: hypothetical protein CL808_02230 [Citromicrobium sp.]|nr:hypothetical protein [Citromicrobium sp.]